MGKNQSKHDLSLQIELPPPAEPEIRIALGRILSGAQFNNDYRGTRFYKILNAKMRHYHFQYREGLNIDSVYLRHVDDFATTIEVGFHFCTYKQLPIWSYLGNKYAEVIIPDDAVVLVYDEDERKCYPSFKASRIELRNILPYRNK